jgi:outer membrane protein assembly factor BamB
VNGFGRAVAVLGVVVALALATDASASDWPQYLGPQSDGVVHDASGLARTWPATGPKMIWEAPVGLGYGGAAVYGDSVLLLDRPDDARDVVRRIRLGDGKDVWSWPYDAPGKLDHNGSRSTPATDGNYVFSIGPFGHLTAVRFSDGTPVWSKNILTDWGAGRPQWGVSTSSLLYGNWVIVMPYGKQAALVAYDKATGNVAWTTPNPKGIGQEYQSPVLTTLDGQDMILAAGGGGYLMGVDAQSGRPLWEYAGFSKSGNHIPSPLAVGDGRIFMTGGYGEGCAMVKVERQGQEWKCTELYKKNTMGSKCAQALLWNGHIYGNSADVGGGLRCLTLEGEVVWDSKTTGTPSFGLGNLIIADGLVYTFNDGGELYMVEATPDGYKQLAKAKVLAPPEPWAPLAFKDGKLIVRDMHKI